MSISAPDAVTFSDLSRNRGRWPSGLLGLAGCGSPIGTRLNFYLTAADREEQREENLSTAARMFVALMKLEAGARVVLLALARCSPGFGTWAIGNWGVRA